MKGDEIFKKLILITGLLVLSIIIALFITLIIGSLISIKHFGFSFITNSVWNPVIEKFGALPFIAGTFITAFLALLISIPFSLSLSIFSGELVNKGKLSSIFDSTLDLLAGIPSVIYGFWGLIILVPLIRKIELKFAIPPFGVGIITASIILSIMIIPYSASLGRESLKLVPSHLKEAGYSLGATRYEIIKKIILPFSKSGIISGFILSLGRAIGETMAVTMLIGNTNSIPKSVFSTGNTMASVIANEFTEASSDLYLSSLIEIALILFLITIAINLIGRKIVKKAGGDSNHE
jgi:phosphate transport system permease protein